MAFNENCFMLWRIELLWLQWRGLKRRFTMFPGLENVPIWVDKITMFKAFSRSSSIGRTKFLFHMLCQVWIGKERKLVTFKRMDGTVVLAIMDVASASWFGRVRGRGNVMMKALCCTDGWMSISSVQHDQLSISCGPAMCNFLIRSPFYHQHMNESINPLLLTLGVDYNATLKAYVFVYLLYIRLLWQSSLCIIWHISNYAIVGLGTTLCCKPMGL